MNNLQTDNAPSITVVKPHFIFAGISFFVASLLIVLADDEILGPFFGVKTVAITHVAVLGWATMIIFGALYQLIPVIFETALFSEKLAKINFWVFAISIASLSYSFWVNSLSDLLIYAAVLLLISLLMFISNLILTYRKSRKKNIQAKFIITAIYWLLVTVILGALIALNFRFSIFEKTYLHYLKIHAHAGLVGWFLLLIIGVASTLVPMFFVSHNVNEKKINYSYYFINAGLLIMLIEWLFFGTDKSIYIDWFLISAGIFWFLSFAWDSFKQRLRKNLDTGMKHTVISLIILIAPVFISVLLILDFDIDFALLLRITTLYGFSIIFGFITSLILGQTYKTLPFIIWLEKYKKLVGKAKTPMPKDLYSETLAGIQLYFYSASIIVLSAALLTGNVWILKAGSYLLLITAIIYNVNLFKIVLHKTKTESLR